MLSVWAVGMIALRTTIAAPEVCPPIDMASLSASADASAEWIVRATNDDNSYVYDWNRAEDTVQPGYNEVRHAGVTMSPYQAAAETGDLSYLGTADRGLVWMQERLIRNDDWAAIQAPQVKLGASSLLLAGLAQRRIATGDEQYDGLMHEVANFLVIMQREDGSFLNFWDPNTGAPNPDITSLYATGEAFWALAMMHSAWPDEGWDEPSRKVADYLSLYRDEAEDMDFPPWADQWAAYGLSEMATWPTEDGELPLNEDNVAYARSIAARFGFLIRVESQRNDGWISGTFRGPQARAAGMGTWVEGATSLWRLAGLDPRLADTREDLGDRSVCAAGMLVDRQMTAEEAERYDTPELAEGAWFRDEVTRMDDQQHALSGLVLTAPILAEMQDGDAE